MQLPIGLCRGNKGCAAVAIIEDELTPVNLLEEYRSEAVRCHRRLHCILESFSVVTVSTNYQDILPEKMGKDDPLENVQRLKLKRSRQRNESRME